MLTTLNRILDGRLVDCNKESNFLYLVATGDALAEVVGVVPLGFAEVRVASRTSLNFSINYLKSKVLLFGHNQSNRSFLKDKPC